tara:strand:- start:674 stop:1141 length:468 start_codon:yes stop_codon:yes gene_type:complete
MPNQAEEFLRYLLSCSTHPPGSFDLKAHVPRIQRILGIDEAGFPLRSCDLPPQPGDDKPVGDSDITWGQIFGRGKIDQVPVADEATVELIRSTSLVSDQVKGELVAKVHSKLWDPATFTHEIREGEADSYTMIRALERDTAWDLIEKVLKQIGHY